MEEYKGNSHKEKEALEKKQIEPVVATPGKKRKKTEVRRLMDLLMADDVDDIKSYIFIDVLIPAIKKLIWDVFTGGLEMGLYGGRSNDSRKSRASKISYTQYYNRDLYESRRDNKSGMRYGPDEILLENRGEAEKILSRMDEIVNVYGVVSIADFYDLAGVDDNNYMNNKYGWTDIRNAQVVRARGGGYIIKFPKALPIT